MRKHMVVSELLIDKMPSLCVKQQDKVIASDASESTLKQCLTIVEKKVRNLEKRKTKLDAYQLKQTEGADLNKDQQDAVAKYEVVLQNLDFARDLHKQFQMMLLESEKLVRKHVRREKIERQHQEISRLRTLLRLNTVLAGFTHDSVKSDFLTGKHGAPVLSEDSVENLCTLGRLVSTGDDLSDVKRLDDASDHILSFLDARDATVTGTTTTYKNIRDAFDAIVDCGYFSRSLSHDSDTDAATTNGHDLHDESVANDTQPEKSCFPTLSTSSLSTSNSVSTSPIDDRTLAMATPEPLPISIATDQLPAISTVTTSFTAVDEPFQFETLSQSTGDDLFYDKKKDAQDIVSALQSSFNFLQDSEIDEDECYGMGYSHDMEIPSDGADLGYRMTSGYSSEYVITSAVPEGLGVTEQFTNNMPGSDTSSLATAVLTYPSHYAANTPMMTTVPYCAPLVTDPYIVQHAGVGYTHPVAYTTGYEAVMPVYSQPMMSAGQMSEDVVTNPQSMNGHMGTCGEEYVAVVTDTEYTGAEDYYTTQTFVPVPDQAHSESSSDVCLNEEAPVDKAEKVQLNPNANEFRSRFSDTPPPDSVSVGAAPIGDFNNDIAPTDGQPMNYHRQMGCGFRGGRGRGRGWPRGGGYYNGRGFHTRYHNNYREDGYRNGGENGYGGSWRGPRRGFRGWAGFRGGRRYERNNTPVDDDVANNEDKQNSTTTSE